MTDVAVVFADAVETATVTGPGTEDTSVVDAEPAVVVTVDVPRVAVPEVMVKVTGVPSGGVVPLNVPVRVITSELFANAMLFEAFSDMAVEAKLMEICLVTDAEVAVTVTCPFVVLDTDTEAWFPAVVATVRSKAAVPPVTAKVTAVPSGTGVAKVAVICAESLPFERTVVFEELREKSGGAGALASLPPPQAERTKDIRIDITTKITCFFAMAHLSLYLVVS